MKSLKIALIFLIILILPFVFAIEEENSVVVPLAITGTEGELDFSLTQVIFPETEQEEFQDIITTFASFDLNFDRNNSFSLNDQINYKRLSIPHYFLRENQNTRKRIYSFNQGRTYVINNSSQELSKDKTLELKLNLNNNTQVMYLVIDSAQSNPIPSMTQFLNISSSTIEVNTIPRYLKINKNSITNNNLLLNLRANIPNLSLQIIELDNNQKVSGMYSTNILQADYDSFNKYTLFQINKNLIEFYCPYCHLKDYGVNENSFSSCGRSIFEEQKKSITEYLSVKENVCLLPDGSRISGFTNESLKLFGLNRLYFEWNDRIPSDLFDYGEYYVDQDQLRVAVSKKLDTITSNNFVEIGSTKYKKGKNTLISKVGVYLEYDLSSITELSTNTSITESLEFSTAVLNSIPDEYKKLTIIDLTNNEPAVSDSEFDRIMQEILVSDYYKVTDYHTHYQITLEKYLDSINNFKTSRINNDDYSKLLYGLEYNTRGYSNVYFSEGLNYFIYNVKPFTQDTTEILNNQHTQLFGNYWKLNLIDNNQTTQPRTVVVNISDIVTETKMANINFCPPTTDLYVNYYSDNQYYSFNPLFLKSINALSYNRGAFFENTTQSATFKYPEIKTNYNNLQDGKIFSVDTTQSNFSINLTKPIIITKDLGEEIIIKYYNGREYVNYSGDLIKINNSREDFSTKETTVIYPPKSEFVNFPLIVESTAPLIFNKEVQENKEQERYVYRLNLENQNFNLSELINNISNSETCFSMSENNFSVWENIDKELDVTKANSYQEFASALDSQETNFSETLANNNQNLEVNTTFAVYTIDESQNLYKQVQAVNNYVQTETELRNLSVLENYNRVYEIAVKDEPTLKKDFIDLFNCNETLICRVSKTRYVPEGSFFERFKNVCVSNTPTECVNFWSSPRVNFCSAFIRNFNNSYFGYRFDSANAWDLAKQPNNKSIWKTTNGTLPESSYDYLIPGSVLGIKHNNTNYWDKEYSPVVVYLGKVGSNHYIIHSWGNTLKIEKLDVFLKTTARGKNAYGYYEDGQIKEIMISNNLYQKLRTKARENGTSLGFVDSSIYDGVIPDYILDSFNNYEMVSTTQKNTINQNMYQELETVYNNILNKNFNIYYKTNYSNNFTQEINQNIRLASEEPMIIILGKYKKIFLVNKENGRTNIISEYPIATGVNGFGCETDSHKTPIGLFKIVQKVGQGCNPLQVIGPNGCEFNNGNPVLASYNSGTARVVTRKLVLDGLEKENIGIGCETGNRNTIYRGIFIHGTNYENSMGQQRSHGCIRMLNNDVITLFNNVSNGTFVYIYNSDTSYSSLLDLENRFTNSGNNLEFTLTGARRPPVRNTTQQQPVRKTMADLETYIDGRINKFRMLAPTTGVSLNYGQGCNTQTLKFPCFLKEALDVEYNAHVINPQSSEFNYIVFKVTRAFGYTLEETAQFWGSVAQESGTSTNINGSQSQFGDSLRGKPAKGVAQIEKGPWSQYEANRYTFEEMVQDFNSVNLSSVIERDPKIGTVTRLTGNPNTIDSRREITALLDLIWTDQSKYSSVVFSAGLKRYLGRQLIKNSQERYNAGRISEPFWESHRLVYDHSDSINFDFAIIYFYKYTGTPNLMYDGIKQYSNLRNNVDTTKTIALKLANYLAFKKEYYMYYYGLKTKDDSPLISTLLEVNNGHLPR